jgi:hypothetical protein
MSSVNVKESAEEFLKLWFSQRKIDLKNVNTDVYNFDDYAENMAQCFDEWLRFGMPKDWDTSQYI